MSRIKLTQKEFVKKVSIQNKNIIIVGTYEQARNKIRVKCKKCNHEWTPFAGSLLQGKGCPKCVGHIKKGLENIKKDISDLNNGNYTLVEEYDGWARKMLFKHNECKHEFIMTYGNFLKGSRCPKCAKLNRISRQIK